MDWPRLLNRDRIRPSTMPGDHRLEFERDYDRSVFSTPVKRLQDKTQVFPLEPHDAIRTRLTHSLEVSSVARGLAGRTCQWLARNQEIGPGVDRQIETIASTCGLLHDLGNPPFGHAGEEAIREWFHRDVGEVRLAEMLRAEDQLLQDFLKFEGNAQTLRLVARLQILADYHGLNLTYGTLSAMCKYTASSDEAGRGGDHEKEKPGYFASENEIVRQIREATGTGPSRNPITFLVEAADDIVFSVADIEDAVKKGVLSWDYLKSELTQAADGLVDEALRRKDRILQGDLRELPPNLAADAHASAFRTAAIGLMVDSAFATFEQQYANIMAGTYHGELMADSAARSMIELFKKIGRQRVYVTQPNLKIELMGRRVIRDLLSLFWEGAQVAPIDAPPVPKDFPTRIGALLSENYLRVFRRSVVEMAQFPQAYHRLQLVTDYVCGMTDSFAKRLHLELTHGAG